jgi:hypothetical protein
MTIVLPWRAVVRMMSPPPLVSRLCSRAPMFAVEHANSCRLGSHRPANENFRASGRLDRWRANVSKSHASLAPIVGQCFLPTHTWRNSDFIEMLQLSIVKWQFCACHAMLPP